MPSTINLKSLFFQNFCLKEILVIYFSTLDIVDFNWIILTIIFILSKELDYLLLNYTTILNLICISILNLLQ